MRNRQGIHKSSLVEEESDMRRDKFEALALLRRWVKEMRANGEMDSQHDAGAATQPQEQIEEESRDFKSSFCESRNKRVKCRNVENLSGTQNEGREWVKSHFMPCAEASFSWRRQKRWDQMTATRADTHCQWVRVTINGWLVLLLDAMTHEGERISIINIHQATARRPDFQRRVNTFRQK